MNSFITQSTTNLTQEPQTISESDSASATYEDDRKYCLYPINYESSYSELSLTESSYLYDGRATLLQYHSIQNNHHSESSNEHQNINCAVFVDQMVCSIFNI